MECYSLNTGAAAKKPRSFGVTQNCSQREMKIQFGHRRREHWIKKSCVCFPFDAVILNVKKGGMRRAGGWGGRWGGGCLTQICILLCGFGKLSVAFPLVM